jgi:hypothetical protein
VTSSLDALPPFNPPYLLSGSALVAVGFWRTSGPSAPVSGFRAFCLFGWEVGVLILSDYQQPPSELPLRYHEVIAARLVHRGLRLASQPFEMVLDEELPVELGRLHYGLPKRLDPALRGEVDAASRGRCFRGEQLEIAWRERNLLMQWLSLPLRLLFALGVWLFTRWVDVLGVGVERKSARIALVPREVGSAVTLRSAQLAGARLFSVWSAHFNRIDTHLGPPKEPEA